MFIMMNGAAGCHVFLLFAGFLAESKRRTLQCCKCLGHISRPVLLTPTNTDPDQHHVVADT